MVTANAVTQWLPTARKKRRAILDQSVIPVKTSTSQHRLLRNRSSKAWKRMLTSPTVANGKEGRRCAYRCGPRSWFNVAKTGMMHDVRWLAVYSHPRKCHTLHVFQCVGAIDQTSNEVMDSCLCSGSPFVEFSENAARLSLNHTFKCLSPANYPLYPSSPKEHLHFSQVALFPDFPHLLHSSVFPLLFIMAAPALTAASSMAVLAIGGAANLVASNKPMQAKSWMPQGGFIGVINGRSAGETAVSEPQASSSPPAAAPQSGKKIHPIGGQTGKPSPPCPFGRFPKHKPSKLPGPPKSYVPANNP